MQKAAGKLTKLLFDKNRFPHNFKWFLGGLGVSNFGGVWSYMAWGKSIFMFFGNIGNSLHHQIPPISLGLQIGPRFVFKARVPSQEPSNKIMFQQMTPRNKIFSGKLDDLPKPSVFGSPLHPSPPHPGVF